jgi:hypothetical protein
MLIMDTLLAVLLQGAAIHMPDRPADVVS